MVLGIHFSIKVNELSRNLTGVCSPVATFIYGYVHCARVELCYTYERSREKRMCVYVIELA